MIFKAQTTRVAKTEMGKVVYYEQNGREQGIEVDDILIGAGRAPNVEGLNLEAAGVRYEGDRGRGVLVNDWLQTTNPHIYAAGDICLPYRYTHLADASARIIIQNALFFGRRKLSAQTIPWCTYTDPEVAQVGLSESAAQKEGVAYQVFVKPSAGSGPGRPGRGGGGFYKNPGPKGLGQDSGGHHRGPSCRGDDQRGNLRHGGQNGPGDPGLGHSPVSHAGGGHPGRGRSL